MKVNLVLVKTVSDIELLTDDKKPCYLLVADEINPQLSYLGKNRAPLTIPFNRYDFSKLKLKTELSHSIDSFMADRQLMGSISLSKVQKKGIYEVTGHTALSFSQTDLTAKINAYLKEKKYDIQADEMVSVRGLLLFIVNMQHKMMSKNFLTC